MRRNRAPSQVFLFPSTRTTPAAMQQPARPNTPARFLLLPTPTQGDAMGGGAFEYDGEMEGAGFVFDGVSLGATDGPVEVELGSLVATLSAVIEDETELDLCLRTVLESSAFRIRVGGGAPEREPARFTAFTRDASFDPSEN